MVLADDPNRKAQVPQLYGVLDLPSVSCARQPAVPSSWPCRARPQECRRTHTIRRCRPCLLGKPRHTSAWIVPSWARHVRAKLADWRGLLTENVQDGRTLLRHVLAGPIRFTPAGRQFLFEGLAAMEKLLAGAVATEMASPPGLEPGHEGGLRPFPCLQARGRESTRPGAGCRGADASANAESDPEGKRARRRIRTSSVHAFELLESARTF